VNSLRGFVREELTRTKPRDNFPRTRCGYRLWLLLAINLIGHVDVGERDSFDETSEQ
jgi:hypothetical protein